VPWRNLTAERSAALLTAIAGGHTDEQEGTEHES
jgi:hypothetical protein